MDPTASPTASTGVVPVDAVDATQTPFLVVLVVLGFLVVVAMFALTFSNMRAARSAFAVLLGIRGRAGHATPGADDPRVLLVSALQSAAAGSGAAGSGAASSAVDQALARFVRVLSDAARPTTGVTRTVLAAGGFSLLTIGLVAVFATEGPGVRDLRAAVVGAVVTLTSTIGGFYFGNRAAATAGGAGGGQTGGADSTPTGGKADTTHPE